MVAQFRTKCSVCNKTHINPGDEIKRMFGSWAASECTDAAFDILKLEQSIRYDMSEIHKIDETELSKEEFYSKALEFNVCTQEEYDSIKERYKWTD